MEITFSCQRPDANKMPLPASYTLMGKQKLPIDAQGVMDWHIVNWGQDIEPFHQVGIFADAFNDWQQELFPWRFRGTADPNKADWKIYHAIKNKIHLPNGDVLDSPFDFLSSKETLAVQYEYYPGFQWSLCMIVNDDHQFGLTHSGHQMETKGVIRHEMGHGLRLGHTNAEGDLMQPIYFPGGKITQDSINGLYAAHGEHLKEYVTKLPNAKRFLVLFGEHISEPQHLENNRGCLSRVFP